MGIQESMLFNYITINKDNHLLFMDALIVHK